MSKSLHNKKEIKMKNTKCGLSNTTMCAMAASVLGLFGTAVLLAAVVARRHCSDAKGYAAKNAEQG